MKFLIDECLTLQLVQTAIDAGYHAQHVVKIGLSSAKDWDLVNYLIKEDYVIVTRNSKDFRGHSGKPGYLTSQNLHPGLICLNAREMDDTLMMGMFKSALKYIADKGIVDLMNQVLELTYAENSGKLMVYFYDAPSLATANAKLSEESI